VRAEATCNVCHASVPGPLIRYAQECAYNLLHADAPRAWERSARAASLADGAVTVLGRPRGEAIIAAAWLHLVGESPRVNRTDFAPVDAAVYLLGEGWPTPVVNLVAHQGQARLIAPAFGSRERLALFDRIQGWPSDILDYSVVLAMATSDDVDPDTCLRQASRSLPASLSITARDRGERERRLRRAVDRVNAALIGARALSPQAG